MGLKEKIESIPASKYYSTKDLVAFTLAVKEVLLEIADVLDSKQKGAIDEKANSNTSNNVVRTGKPSPSGKHKSNES